MPVSKICQRGRHTLCGGYTCECECHPGTLEERKAATDVAVADYVSGLEELVMSSGRHEGHTLEQFGRCVYCSCGERYQGRLPS